MHTYSVDRDLRGKVTIAIFAISMVISMVLHELCSGFMAIAANYLEASRLENVLDLLRWFEVEVNIFGVPFLYAVINFAYNKWMWKLKPIAKLHAIPDLNGTWEGSLISSYNGKRIKMIMEIKQTWNKVQFKSIFPETNSVSYSNVAAIHVDANNGKEIYFGFKNESHDVSTSTQSYDGYNILDLMTDNQIEARYFNNRPNPNTTFKGGNVGSFSLRRITEEVVSDNQSTTTSSDTH